MVNWHLRNVNAVLTTNSASLWHCWTHHWSCGNPLGLLQTQASQNWIKKSPYLPFQTKERLSSHLDFTWPDCIELPSWKQSFSTHPQFKSQLHSYSPLHEAWTHTITSWIFPTPSGQPKLKYKGFFSVSSCSSDIASHYLLFSFSHPHPLTSPPPDIQKQADASPQPPPPLLNAPPSATCTDPAPRWLWLCVFRNLSWKTNQPLTYAFKITSRVLPGIFSLIILPDYFPHMHPSDSCQIQSTPVTWCPSGQMPWLYPLDPSIGLPIVLPFIRSRA